jgi:hypothetical protein
MVRSFASARSANIKTAQAETNRLISQNDTGFVFERKEVLNMEEEEVGQSACRQHLKTGKQKGWTPYRLRKFSPVRDELMFF